MNSLTDVSVIKKLAILFLAFAGLYFAKNLLVPICIAAILSALFLPLCRWLENRNISRIAAALTCLVCLLLIISVIAIIVGWQITALANGIVTIREKIFQSTDSFQQYLFDHFGIAKNVQSQFIIDKEGIVIEILSLAAGSFLTFLTKLIFVLIYVLFFLYYRNHIKNFLVQLAHPENEKETNEIISSAAGVSQQYLSGVSKIIVILWIIYALCFSVLGLKNALLLAIVCGLFEIIPYLGNILGTALNVLLALVNGADLYLLTGIVVIYALIQLFRGWILEPLILGPQVKINPLSTIIALVIGEMVWGIPGIILSIPLTAIIKIIFDHINGLKAYGFLIGEVQKPRILYSSEDADPV
jgi:predicted PurR-regulated permease PerM